VQSLETRAQATDRGFRCGMSMAISCMHRERYYEAVRPPGWLSRAERWPSMGTGANSDRLASFVFPVHRSFTCPARWARAGTRIFRSRGGGGTQPSSGRHDFPRVSRRQADRV
jgi:hypothetical protein